MLLHSVSCFYFPGGFIHGDASNTNLTVSNAQSSYTGLFICTLCYGASFTRCTNSSVVQLRVLGTGMASVTSTLKSL